jgi:hypothetical protein
MAPLVRRSPLNEFLIVVSCTFSACLPIPLASAQHPAARPAGGVVHISAPPVPHVPISPAPMIHAPIISAPLTSPRTWAPADALGTCGLRFPRRPIRPFPPVVVVYQPPFLFGGPFWGSNSCWWATCDLFWPWTLSYTTNSSSGPINYIPEVYGTPANVYGEERPDLPEIYLKDGTILSVTDYWLVSDQLHFTMIEQDGAKPVEHTIPFDALDWQTTVEANTRRGFRVMLRNEPFEQYVRDHPEGPPPAITPPHE